MNKESKEIFELKEQIRTGKNKTLEAKVLKVIMDKAKFELTTTVKELLEEFNWKKETKIIDAVNNLIDLGVIAQSGYGAADKNGNKQIAYTYEYLEVLQAHNRRKLSISRFHRACVELRETFDDVIPLELKKELDKITINKNADKDE